MKRKYTSQLLLIGILLFFQSCEIDIMNNRRILVKGSIVDSSNNPISNISVRSEAYGATMGETVSDANGQFQFTSLEAESNYPLDIVVNMQSYGYNYGGGYNYGFLENADYSGKHYFNNSRKRRNSSYDLGQIELREIALLTIFFNNIRGDNNVVAYKFEYESAICQIDLNLNSPENCQFLDDFYNQLDPTTSNFQSNLYCQLGTTVLLTYIMNNEPKQTISIPLTNPETIYVFEY